MALGSIIIRLSMATADFETDTGRAAKIAQRRAREIDQAFTKAGKAIGIALGAGLAVAGAAFSKYMANTIAAEKVQAQLTSRIKDTGAAAGRSIEQLNAQAEKLQNLTVFDDESIGGVQAMLLTFREIKGLEFDNATAAVLDLATAMGADLNSAALQLGKALNDPIGGISALSRAGVQFSDDQKKVIKSLVETGDVASAQRIILGELEGQMGTAAEAARNTLGGALQGLSNSFDNLLEGDAGGDGVRGAVTAINQLNTTLNDPGIKRGVDSAANGILQIVNASVRLIATLGDAGSALQEFFGANEKKGLISLQNKRNDLESELFRRERAGPLAIGNAGDPLAKLFGYGSGDRVKDLKSEIAQIDGLIDARQRAAATDTGSGKFNAAYERASLNFNPNPSRTSTSTPAGRTGGSRKARAAAMPDFMGADQEALRRMVEETARAEEEFARMAATLSGPLASAEYEHQRNLEHITALGKEAGRSTSELNDLRGLETERYKDQREEIERSLDPIGQLLESMRLEVESLGMSNAEREVSNMLRRQGIGLMSDEAKSALATAAGYARQAGAMGDQIELMDGLRDSARGFLKDLSKGVGIWDSLANAANSFADVLFDMASRQLIKQLFGPDGSSGGGGWGDAIGGLLGKFFGGGKASGGWTMPNTVYEVNERGMEMASVGGRDYMLTGNQPVHVTPNNKLGGGRAVTINNTINVPATMSHRTAEQVARTTGLKVQQSMARA